MSSKTCILCEKLAILQAREKNAKIQELERKLESENSINHQLGKIIEGLEKELLEQREKTK